MNPKNLKQLYDYVAQGLTPEFTFFWGPKNNYVEFSQWYSKAPFTVNGVLYHTAEHWMMASKARLFKDFEIEKQILKDKRPREAQRLGRLVKNFKQATWNDACFDIVTNGNFFKFRTHEHLKDLLLSTAPKILVEASPNDKVWGVGLSEDDNDIQDPFKWKGINLLGFALMKVRDELGE